MVQPAISTDDDTMNDTTNEPIGDPPTDPSDTTTRQTATATATMGQPTQQPPPPATPQQRLYRDPSGPIAGVATGIARFFGIDPIIVQVAFVVGTVLGGAGLLLYVALWLTLPTVNMQGHLVRPERWKIVIGLTLLVLFAFGAAAAFGRPGGGALAVILIAVGIVLLNQTPGRAADLSAQVRETLSPPPGTIHPAPMASAPAAPAMPTSAAPSPTPTYAAPTYAVPGQWGVVQPEPVASYDPPPPRLPITALTLAAASILAGFLLVLDLATGLSIGPAAIWGAFVLVCGIGLIVSAFTGRGAWLLLIPAAVSLIAMASVNIEPNVGDFTVGQSTYVVDSPDELSDGYAVTVGELTLDLSNLELDHDRTVELRARAGQIRIFVPDDMPIDLRAEFEAGEVNFFEENIDNGTGVVRRTRGDVGDEPTLTIDADFTLGQLDIGDS